MQLIKDQLFQSKAFQKIVLPEKPGIPLQITGLSGSSRAFFIAWLVEARNEFVVILNEDTDSSERLYEDLQTLLGEQCVGFLPAQETSPYSDADVNPSVRRLYLEALQKSRSDEPLVLITCAEALQTRLAAPDVFFRQELQIKKAGELDLSGFVRQLLDGGYERSDFVEDVGQFSVRGGIIDVYPFTSDDPVRIELFGNEIESLRTFNVVTQRSIEEIAFVSILAANENKMDATIFDYIPDHAFVLFEERLTFMDSVDSWFSKCEQAYKSHIENNIFPDRPNERYLSPESIQGKLSVYRQLEMNLVLNAKLPVWRFASATPPTFSGSIKRFISFLKKARSERKLVIIQCDTKGQSERLLEILIDENCEDAAMLMVSAVHNGFIWHDPQIVILTDHEIFDRYKRRKTYRRFRNGEYLRSLSALNLNDYVVHIDYGIGQYMGLETITSGNGSRECIRLNYAEGDTLFVSIDRLNRVQKYSGDDAAPASLTRLRTGEWERVKKKTSESVQKIAAELLELYAKRKASEGISYSVDNHMQRELEAAFPYEETEDQLRSIEEVKRDLETGTPMDRLLCGDVGYGKTEVAIRAAFKVIMDGKQVALLVPTTILAYQHFQTFRERMADFAVNLEMLSRFRTPARQKEALEKLARGEIDIIIATHRLLSKDVVFKDLGLLIVDEEQRFGVKHKEKLKEMRVNVDVLTMTATPIPRTMHLSLMGARDLSHIETPPRNRLPVTTEVHEWDDFLIRQAVRRELDRGGQVYFVHNRVQTIEEMRGIVAELVPDARIAVAHGQLPEKQLEKIMMAFIHREYDVLISTMIIENGLDIPNVNTIIIDKADHFGLAQLYQLRGRVGRSDQQAYAYLLIRSMGRITELARKRLHAIQDFTELGSGFKVALRDMEIRGVGNILGKQQSGNVQSVGFELYCNLMDEAVKQQRAEKAGVIYQPVENRYSDPILDAHEEMNLPEDYISDEKERVTIYHRLVNLKSVAGIEKLKDELRDRFGSLPERANYLFSAIELKVLAGRIYASRLVLKDSFVQIHFSEKASNDKSFYEETIPRLMNAPDAKVKFLNQKEQLGVQIYPNATDAAECLLKAKKVLQNLS